MPKVQLFKGSKEKLNSTTLNNGSIYFIPEERRLYIDTATARIPIMGGGLECYLHFNEWTDEIGSGNAISTTFNCYLQKGNYSSKLNLNKVLGQDSIIFIGKIYVGNTNNLSTIDDVEVIENNNGSLTIKPFDFPTTSSGTKTYYTTSNIPDNDLWIYLYCPNPKIAGIIEPTSSSVITTTATIYGLDIDDTNETWYRDANRGEYRYDLFVEDFDLINYPFMITLSDDSLENYRDFDNKYIVIDDIEKTTGGSIIHFITDKNEETNYEPAFNMTVDIISFINEKQINSNNGSVFLNTYTLPLYGTNLMINTSEYNETTFTLTASNIIDEGTNETISIQDAVYSDPFELENGKLITTTSLATGEYFTPLNQKSKTINTNIRDWDVDTNYYYTAIPIANNNIEVKGDNIVKLGNKPDSWANLETYNKVNYYIDTNQLLLYYRENSNHNPEIHLNIRITLTIEEKNTLQDPPTFLFYQQNNTQNSSIIYTLYHFIDSIEALFDTDNNPQCVSGFKIKFIDELKCLLDKQSDFSEKEKTEIKRKYRLTDIDGKEQNTSLDGCQLTAIQLNNLAYLYKTVLLKTSDNWLKVEDLAAFEKQYFNSFERDVTRKNNQYYVCIKPSNIDQSNYFKLQQKHLPIVFPLNHYEEFNQIVETKIASNGKIYFYAKAIPTQDINICIADFK